jgi:hypothetical protein
MKKIRQFKCQVCDEYSENYVEDNVKEFMCDCGGVKLRMISAPRYFNNTTGKSPSSNYKKVK